MGLCCNENTDLGESGKRVEKDKSRQNSIRSNGVTMKLKLFCSESADICAIR